MWHIFMYCIRRHIDARFAIIRDTVTKDKTDQIERCAIMDCKF